MKTATAKPLALDEKPDYVLWPTNNAEGGWEVGRVEPDVKGYTKTKLTLEATQEGAENYCYAEAKRRGINRAQVDAAVGSSMFPTNYFYQLNFKHKRK